MYNCDKLKSLYEKVIAEPNKNLPKKGCIKCPDCGEEILMIPTLKVMNQAIENHVNLHREQLKENAIQCHSTAIKVRLALVEQVLQISCKISVD